MEPWRNGSALVFGCQACSPKVEGYVHTLAAFKLQSLTCLQFEPVSIRFCPLIRLCLIDYQLGLRLTKEYLFAVLFACSLTTRNKIESAAYF